MNQNTYIELLPNSWFEMKSFIRAQDYVNIPQYDKPKHHDVQKYLSMTNMEKLKFIQSYNNSTNSQYYYSIMNLPKYSTYIDELTNEKGRGFDTNKKKLYNELVKVCDDIKIKELEEKIRTEMESKVKVSEKKPYKKKAIPKALKSSVWIKYVGKEIGTTKCLCCNVHDISQLDFDCGHVIAESLGGATDIDNLRPICSKCNKSMKVMNMDEFKTKFFK